MLIATGTDEQPVLLLDSSVAVALIIDAHELHDATMAATHGRRLGLAGHAWFETYSVTTRLPAGERRSPAEALRLMTYNFPMSVFLDADASAQLGPELVQIGISGGSVYDALVGAAARHHRLALLSADGRARPTYEALGVELLLIAP